MVFAKIGKYQDTVCLCEQANKRTSERGNEGTRERGNKDIVKCAQCNYLLPARENRKERSLNYVYFNSGYT
jgi:hypothetical protein